MKVLVVDDDPNAQKVLSLLIQKIGHSPIIHGVEESGYNCATGTDQPHLIFVDWKNNGIQGPNFVKRVRAANPEFRPHIIVFSAKSGKDEIAEALDAGADDFIVKPPNIIELSARIRAACRIVQYQRDLLLEKDTTDTLAQRNNLLGEIISKQQSAKIPAIMQSAAAAVTAVGAASGQKTGEFSQYEIRFLMSASLMELKLVLEQVKQRLLAPPLRSQELCAWAGVLLPQQGVWVDLTIGCKAEDAAAVFLKSLGRKPASTPETSGFLAEVTRIVASSFMRTLRLRDPEAHIPVMTRCVQPGLSNSQPSLNDAKSYDLTVENRPFVLTLSSTLCPREEINPAEVRELDVLADQFPPKTMSEVPILKQGTIINSRYMEKLHEQAALTDHSYKAIIHRPTLLARFFHNI